MGIGSFPG